MSPRHLTDMAAGLGTLGDDPRLLISRPAPPNLPAGDLVDPRISAGIIPGFEPVIKPDAIPHHSLRANHAREQYRG